MTGDPNKPRAWSKYAPDSSLNTSSKSKRKGADIEKGTGEEPVPQLKKKKKEEEILDKCRDDPDFLEFLESHRKKSAWGNDTIIEELEKQALAKAASREKNQSQLEEETPTILPPAETSKSKKKSKKERKEEEEPTETEAKEKSKAKKKSKKRKEGEEDEDEQPTEPQPTEEKKKKKKKRRKKTGAPEEEYFTLKLRDLPAKAKKKDIKEFFAPINPKSIRYEYDCHLHLIAKLACKQWKYFTNFKYDYDLLSLS